MFKLIDQNSENNGNNQNRASHLRKIGKNDEKIVNIRREHIENEHAKGGLRASPSVSPDRTCVLRACFRTITEAGRDLTEYRVESATGENYTKAIKNEKFNGSKLQKN